MNALRIAIQLPGRTVWIWIWVVLLTLGAIGLWGAVQWARETHWRNLDEVLRGAGTVAVSVGMILFLGNTLELLGLGLMLVALACFVGAFITGKRLDEPRDEP
jgi:CDP-diglyceride synthetase